MTLGRWTKTFLVLWLMAITSAIGGCGEEELAPYDGASTADSAPDLAADAGGADRLSSDPRMAVVLEAFYALDPAHNGTSTKSLNGWAISDWNYLANDLNAYNVIKSWYGGCSSMWGGPHSGDLKTCAVPYKQMGNFCYYHSPSNYGIYGSYGRGGQCKGFVNLLLYRSSVRQKVLPTYSAARADYDGPRKYTKDASKSRLGDILFRKDGTHTAVVVKILAGTEGQSVTSLDVIDSNLVTWGGKDEEIIGRHIVDTSGRYGSYGTLGNYYAIDLQGAW
ncbi:MAG: hypothetical protein U0610_17575 [bacterium]